MALSPRSLLIPAGLLVVALAGCSQGWYPEGRYVSDDKYRYDSTALQPTTIVLVDTRTNATLYTWEIPVDHELVIQFEPKKGDKSRVAPDLCEWDIWTIGKTSGTPSHSFACPTADSRRVDVFIRPAELPAEMRPGVPGPNLPPRERPSGEPQFNGSM